MKRIYSLASFPPVSSFQFSLATLLRFLSGKHSPDNDTARIWVFPYFLPNYTQSLQAGDKTFYNLASTLFLTFSFCESYLKRKKTNCLILVSDDSYFSYSVDTAKYKPPTSFGAQQTTVCLLLQNTGVCSGEMEQRHRPRGLSTLLLLLMTFILVMIDNSNLDCKIQGQHNTLPASKKYIN